MAWTRTEVNTQTGESVVVNQVAYTNGDDYILLDEGVQPPAGYTATDSIPPTPDSVPAVVTMRQARLALHAAGLLAQVDAAIDSMPEPPRTEARIEWDYSSTVERNKPFVAMIGQALGLDDQQMDDLFITAAAL